jgi:hypothetical protein
MQRVNYALPAYPNLSFTTAIEGSQYYQVKHAIIEAQGPADALIMWWQDLVDWCAQRKDCILVNKGVRSGDSDPALVTFGGSPEALVPFIVQWLGLDWLEQALQGSPPAHSSAADLKAILDRLAAIEDNLFKNYRQTVAVDYRLWAAGQALHGKPVQPPSKLEPELSWDEAPNGQPAEPKQS